MTPEEEFVENLRDELHRHTGHRVATGHVHSSIDTGVLSIDVRFNNGEIERDFTIMVSLMMLKKHPNVSLQLASQDLFTRWYTARLEHYLGDDWRAHMNTMLGHTEGDRNDNRY